MPTLRVDGRSVGVAEGATVLAAARASGAHLPTLCHHEALEPWGGCRLCLVDVAKDGWSGGPRLVAACLYPAQDGLIVQTASPRALATRRAVIDLLLARCPETPLVQQLAREHGIERTSYEVNAEPTDCVLCGLCTRACDRMGISAISSVSRGAGRSIAPPFDQPPPDCIGCLACAQVCPTGHIRADEGAEHRSIWGRTFEMRRCRECGRAEVTMAQVAWAVAHGADGHDFELCAECKREALARTIRAVSAGASPDEARRAHGLAVGESV